MKIEAYDVTFENFTPDCGMVLYQDIEDKILPYRRKFLAEIKGEVDRLRSELELLNSLDSDVHQIRKGAEGLSAKLDSDSGRKIHSLLLAESEGTEPDAGRCETADGFITWLRECQERKSEIDGLLSAAKAKVEGELEEYLTTLGGNETVCSFYEDVLQLMRGLFIFDHAANKYKNKICRDMIKLISECRQLSEKLLSGPGRAGLTPDEVNLASGISCSCDGFLKFFRRFKEVVADAGVEKATATIGHRVKDRHAWSMYVRQESQGVCQWHRVSPGGRFPVGR